MKNKEKHHNNEMKILSEKHFLKFFNVYLFLREREGERVEEGAEREGDRI